MTETEKNPRKLRPWLEKMIESDKFPGLKWMNTEKTIFRIPWKHAGKFSWREEDCLIFKAWAEHRGKYVEGVDKYDPATWKTRLRCALNKLPDVLERKDLSRLDGAEAFRVYELLPEQEKHDSDEIYPRHLWSKEAKERDMEYDTGYNSSNSPNSSLSSDLLGPESPASSSTEKQPVSPDSPARLINVITHERSNSSTVLDVKKPPLFGTIQTRNGPMVFSVLAPGTLANLNAKKQVVIKSLVRHVRFSVKYFGREVCSWNFRAKSMCRLTSEKKPMDVKYPNPIYNEKKMSKVVLPKVPAFADEQLKHAASEIIKSMRYGLVIHRENDSLKLYRLSQCRVFVVDEDQVVKLTQLTPYELNLKKRRNIMVYFGQKPEEQVSKSFLSMQITT